MPRTTVTAFPTSGSEVRELSNNGNYTGWTGSQPIGGGDPSVESLSSLACAATAVARVQTEIDDLWRHSMHVENGLLSDRLVEVSRALQRAARLLEEERAIG
ncbi:MAG: hypothetical protein ABI658_14110 [Acidimicrobiales bacterium]